MSFGPRSRNARSTNALLVIRRVLLAASWAGQGGLEFIGNPQARQSAVERLALRAVAPRRAARRLRPPRAARSARAEWSQRDHPHHQMTPPSQAYGRPH